MNAKMCCVLIGITGACADMDDVESIQTQQEIMNQVANGKSCHVLLEGQGVMGLESKKASRILSFVCNSDGIPASELSSQLGTLVSYKVIQFYDNTQYAGASIAYYGSYKCSQGYSYGIDNLYGGNWNNRFDSALNDWGAACNHGEVYDRPYFGTPMYSFTLGSPDFLSMKNATTSWRVYY